MSSQQRFPFPTSAISHSLNLLYFLFLFVDKHSNSLCFQCGLYGSCHGVYMFFPEIIDKITTYSNHWPLNRATTCEILQIESVDVVHNATMCLEQMEVSTFGYSIVLEILYMVGFLVISLIINRVTKSSIMTFIIFTCGICGFTLQILDIPVLAIFVYMVFICTFMAVNVLNSVTIDLYPTRLR